MRNSDRDNDNGNDVRRVVRRSLHASTWVKGLIRI